MSLAIPQNVKQLLMEHIDAFETLEILLLLHATEPKEWTVQEIACHLRSSLESVEGRLKRLSIRGLLENHTASNTTCYRFAPRFEEHRHAVQALAKCYSERRVTVIEMIFSKPLEQIQVFADAFRLR